MNEILKFFYPSKYTNFQNLGPFSPPFLNEMAKFLNGPLKTHKDDHYAKNCIKIGWKMEKSSNFEIPHFGIFVFLLKQNQLHYNAMHFSESVFPKEYIK